MAERDFAPREGRGRRLMDGIASSTPAAEVEAPDTWACVEVFGHRRHYGRVTEVEKFGTKMMRVDVPGAEPESFETFFYGGGSIFSLTPMTEAAARAYAERDRPKPYTPRSALPPPEMDSGVGLNDDDGAAWDEEGP